MGKALNVTQEIERPFYYAPEIAGMICELPFIFPPVLVYFYIMKANKILLQNAVNIQMCFSLYGINLTDKILIKCICD